MSGISEDDMSFSREERTALLAIKGVGPTVIERLEQIGFTSLQELADAEVNEIVVSVASIVNSTCWKNSPQARAAIRSAIDLAKTRQ